VLGLIGPSTPDSPYTVLLSMVWTAAMYKISFDNVMGVISTVLVERTDGSDVIPHHSLLSVAFIDTMWPGATPRFAWHNNVEEMEEFPFTEEWAIEQYVQRRNKAQNEAI
jgi:hypothetical protein